MRFRAPTIGPREDYLPATIEQGGKRYEARVHRRSRLDGVISAEIALHPGTLLQCHVSPPDKEDSWLSVLAEVKGVQRRGKRLPSRRQRYQLRWRRAWCRQGIPGLLRRLQWFLGCARHDFCEGTVRSMSGGGFYEFPVDSGELPMGPGPAQLGRSGGGRPAPQLDLAGSRACERGGREGPAPRRDTGRRLHDPFRQLEDEGRVPLDHPCRWVIGEAESFGQLCDVSGRGIYVAVRTEPPEIGERVIVMLDPLIGDRRHRVALTGVVGWRNHRTDGARPPGFGLLVQSVVDGCKGHAFERFLAERTGRNSLPAVANENAPGVLADPLGDTLAGFGVPPQAVPRSTLGYGGRAPTPPGGPQAIPITGQTAAALAAEPSPHRRLA